MLLSRSGAPGRMMLAFVTQSLECLNLYSSDQFRHTSQTPSEISLEMGHQVPQYPLQRHKSHIAFGSSFSLIIWL
jgi:hypothetical protein